MGQVKLSRLVETTEALRATRSRKAKSAALADCLRDADETEVLVVASYLSGALRQRRTGLGWRSLTTLAPPTELAELDVLEVHARFAELAEVSGAGSRERRAALTDDLFGRATAREQDYLRGLVTGELRQGALEGLLVEAIAEAFAVPATRVRRAVMLAGSAPFAAHAAATGGAAALDRIGLEVGRPIKPMLAASAPDLVSALEKVAPDGGAVVLDTKLDGIRIQVHRDGHDVSVWSRSLDDITDRMPEVVEVVRALRAERLVLDGEAIAMAADGRPRPFQETASRTATHAGSEVRLTPWFFDLLHVDGTDLLDTPASARLDRLRGLVPEEHVVSQLVTADPEAAAAFNEEVLARGHEGVVVKSLLGTWQAGRRASGWVKVKPRHTLDLVVLAVEWGSGRRRGWLSNIHLGARDSSGGFTMLGKTFKGMSDEILAWQTERFLGLEESREGHVVHLRPEQVVEIAFDGLQRSTRYPGGLALRFARVVRYRDDKSAAEADTLETVRSLS